jgi:hypothetical protein
MQKMQCSGNLGAKKLLWVSLQPPPPSQSKSEPLGAKAKLQMHRKELDSNRIELAHSIDCLYPVMQDTEYNLVHYNVISTQQIQSLWIVSIL